MPNAIDFVIRRLHTVAGRPELFEQMKHEITSLISEVKRNDHKWFLELKLTEIETHLNSKEHLAVIRNQIDEWTTREFPVSRGYQYRS